MSTSASLTMLNPFTGWITTNCGKLLKRWEYQTTLPASWEICMQVKKQQLEKDMEQQTGSKLGDEYIKVVYCHPAYLIYMQSILCEMLDWMKNKLESRDSRRNINNLRYADDTTLMAETDEELKSLLMKVKWCERPCCWARLKAGGEGDDRGWDDWMASSTLWTWVWASSRSWWWTGKPGVLQSTELQRFRHDWVTELNWWMSMPLQKARPTYGPTSSLWDSYPMTFSPHWGVQNSHMH